MYIDEEKCSGCMACINICPSKAITIVDDLSDGMVVDSDKCLNCDLCVSVCPFSSKNADFNTINKCYAAWTTDIDQRKKSASGGIAAELYKYYADNNWWFIGTVIDDKGYVRYEITKDKDMIEAFSGSKYVFSDMNEIYEKVVSVLKHNREKVLFIGLPCHCSALKKYIQIKMCSDENLFIIDLLCHGVPRKDFFINYISYIRDKYDINDRRCKVSFRDSEYGTGNFVFTLRNTDGEILYKRDVISNDLYQIGYHKALIYKKMCYSCIYSSEKRIGDITLGDFPHVGSVEKYDYDKDNISCVLINTLKAQKIFDELYYSKKIQRDDRPLEEIIKYESRLNGKPYQHRNSERFNQYIENGQGFIKAAKKCLIIDRMRNTVKCWLNNNQH